MTALATTTPASTTHADTLNVIDRFALACVWLAIVSGGVVLSEPAPVDMLTMGLILLLPLLGLALPMPALMVAFCPWLFCAAGALLATTQSQELDRSATHTAISIYLYAAAFVLAAFVSMDPRGRVKLIYHAYGWAAVVAAIAGIVGYFNLVGDFSEMLTRFGRGSGTFKDPNVLGAFLAPAMLHALHQALHERGTRAVFALMRLALLTLGILVSFSRGAWLNAGLAITFYGLLSMTFAPSNRQRLKIIALGAAAFAVGAAVLLAASEIDAVSKLLEERASVTQSYDEGPEGRFGGQAKAARLILDNPLGLGALQFGAFYHHEDVHNVYLSMFLNAGWIGGLAFAGMVVLTLLAGGRHVLRSNEARALFVIAFSAFAAVSVEGFVIDIDHWRHFYLLLAILWGMMTAPGSAHIAQRRSAIVRGRSV
jgi:hypothetical protein